MDWKWLIETTASPLIFLIFAALILFASAYVPESRVDDTIVGVLIGAAVTRIKLPRPSNGNGSNDNS